MSLDMIVFIIYMLGLLILGVSFSRKVNKSVDDYLLGGRSLGPAVTAMTIFFIGGVFDI